MTPSALSSNGKHDALVWKLQRAGWAAWLVTLLLLIAGIYGHGFLERTHLAATEKTTTVSFLQNGAAAFARR